MAEHFEIASVTGVDVQLNVAGPGARSYAFVIDWHIRLLVALVWLLLANLLFGAGLSLADTEAAGYGAYLIVVWLPGLVIYALYHPILEIVMRGRTPGKRIAGVRIVTLDGQVPSVFALLIRNVLRLVDSLPVGYVVGLTTAVLTEKSVRIGDIAAGTLLVYDGTGGDGQTAPGVLDPTAIASHGLVKSELARELLDRWDQLDEARRCEMGADMIRRLGGDPGSRRHSQSLKAQLEQLLRHPPATAPPG